MGYIVWGEHGNWGLNWTKFESLRYFLLEIEEEIERDFNHPSIIGWCPYNETWEINRAFQDKDVLKIVYRTVKALDKTRPCIDTSGNFHVITDIFDLHDYDQNPETLKKRYEDIAKGELMIESHRLRTKIAPNFISEYGGIKWDINSNLDNAWGYGNAPQSEEEFLTRFKGLTEALMFNHFITGICYTQLTDIEQETNGLYTYDRQAKFDVDYFKKILSQKASCEE